MKKELAIISSIILIVTGCINIGLVTNTGEPSLVEVSLMTQTPNPSQIDGMVVPTEGLMLRLTTPSVTATLFADKLTLTTSIVPEPVTTPTFTSTSTSTITPTPIHETVAKVIVDFTYIRRGPGPMYRALVSVTGDTELTVIGRDHEAEWLVVSLPDDQQGWIETMFVETSFQIENLPIVQSPPTPVIPIPTPNLKRIRIYPPGDINRDCIVDDTDRDIWQAAYGTKSGESGFDESADLNGDGVIDVLDYTIWYNHYEDVCTYKEKPT